MPKGNHSALKNISGLGSKVGQLLCWMFDAPIDLLIACSNSIKIFEHLTKCCSNDVQLFYRNQNGYMTTYLLNLMSGAKKEDNTASRQEKTNGSDSRDVSFKHSLHHYQNNHNVLQDKVSLARLDSFIVSKWKVIIRLRLTFTRVESHL